jgi:hypothetical protein
VIAGGLAGRMIRSEEEDGDDVSVGAGKEVERVISGGR